jgi:hypothetical protein
MDTIDIRRDPCADAIAIGAAMAPEPTVRVADEAGATEPSMAFRPGRERPVRYMQHPSYRRFLRRDRLVA